MTPMFIYLASGLTYERNNLKERLPYYFISCAIVVVQILFCKSQLSLGLAEKMELSEREREKYFCFSAKVNLRIPNL